MARPSENAGGLGRVVIPGRYTAKRPPTYEQKIAQALRNVGNKARKRGIPFSITMDDLVINTVCPVLGLPLTHEGDRNNAPSIDKIIPDLGYVPGNVRVISGLANRWKDNMSVEDAKLLISNWDKISP